MTPRTVVVIALALMLSLGACKAEVKHDSNFSENNTSDVSERSSDTGIPSDYKLADPCPPGVNSVYQRPDGAYVVQNPENNNKWTEITMSPAQFCAEWAGK